MSSKNYQVFWQEALKQLKEQNELNFWFKMDYVEDEGNVIKVNIPSTFMRDQIISNGYIEKIKNKLIQLTGQNDFVIDMKICETQIPSSTENQNLNNQNQQNENLENNSNLKSQNQKNSEEKNSYYYPEIETENSETTEFQHPQLMEKFQFSNFVPGENNNYAYSASLAAAKNPGKAFNPILLYGGVGLGKTHLMQSIGNYIFNEKKGQVKLCFISAENFLNEFTDSIMKKCMNKFKNKYRNLDVFLLDDIHFMQGKDALQEECFHTFNALMEHGAQMVFTCDRPVNELTEFTDRLKTRFASGVCIDLKPPSYENRVAIIKKKLETENQKLDPDVIDYIAKNVQMNVRELEACIKKVVGYQDLINTEVNIDIVKDLLKDTITGTVESFISLDTIFKVVSKATNISISDIKGKKRQKQITEARHIAIYVARNLLEYSFPELAVEFGGKNHSTLVTAYRNLNYRYTMEPVFRAKINSIMEEVKNYKVTQ